MKNLKVNDMVEMLLRLHFQSSMLKGEKSYDFVGNLEEAVHSALIVVEVTSKFNPLEAEYWQEVKKELKKELEKVSKK